MATSKSLPKSVAWPLKTIAHLLRYNLRFRTFDLAEDGQTIWMIFDPTSKEENIPKVLARITPNGVAILIDAQKGRGREIIKEFLYNYHEKEINTIELQALVMAQTNNILKQYGVKSPERKFLAIYTRDDG
jgi:hypothetical protein